MQLLTPPMGWNSWNTFGTNISDSLIRETAHIMKDKGYLDAGYNYIVIDDCWSLHDRDKDGRLVPDPEKFPKGMKDLSDELHALGFKFGMYSCAGVLTCGGYPASYDHEFLDAETFASWGVDYLKYDFCNFPSNANALNRYATMSMALKSTGRDILLAACNWGHFEPWKWMKSIGVHMYRSTGDIQDNFNSFTKIARAQLPNFCMSGPNCFNDIDMLTVGMYGKGNVALGQVCTDEEYQMQFALWCMLSAPLMLGADVRNMPAVTEKLVLHPELLRINQDAEGRVPQPVYAGRVLYTGPDVPLGWEEFPDTGLTLFKHMSDHEFAVGYFNFAPKPGELPFIFADAGLPDTSGFALHFTDAMTGEDLGTHRNYFNLLIPSHACRILTCRMEKA